MASPQDNGVVFGVESTFGTIPTLNRWVERLPGSQFKLNKKIVQGDGLRVGSRVARSTRRVITRYDPTVSLPFEAQSKGQGLLWQALMGAGTSTLVSGSTFQQLFTFGDTPPSIAAQNSLYNAGTGVMDKWTYPGLMCDSFDLNFDNGDIVKVASSWLGKSGLPDTSTAIPAFTAAAVSSLFSTLAGVITTGTLTAPTATALASAPTTVAEVRGGSISVNNNLRKRPNIGGDAKPIPGIRQPTGKLDIEYASSTFVNAVLNDTPLNLILTWSGAALSTGLETLQIVIPEIKFDEDLAQDNGPDDVPMIGAQFTGLDNLTAAQPMWVVVRTSDNAL